MAGEVCTPSWHEPILTVPPWWIEAIVPLWLPRWPESTLTEQIAGHINVLGETRTPGSITPNTLVHFAGPRMERPLEGLARALSHMRRANMSLLVVLVLPRGTFDNRSREVEARLGSLGERFAGRLVITEDFAGGWTKTFAATDDASTHLINARGEFVWKQEGRLDSDGLARALDEHGLDAPPARNVPLRLAVQPGDAAPEAHLMDDQGNQTALRRLRGQRVLLNFWQSWSAPCLRELHQLQELQQQGGAPLIFAINGGEDRTVLDDVRRRHNLTLSLIQDPNRLVAVRYGVRCWPTTVSINQEGIVDRIQFGLTHEHRQERPRAQA
jgi:peroxiredoxin